MFKLGKNQNVFLDNFCFNPLLQFDANPASTLVPANFRQHLERQALSQCIFSA
jgi:hypothetical protein